MGGSELPEWPVVQGIVDSWRVIPPFPNGITLNAITGAIEGSPKASSPLSTYTVTAANPGGSTSTQVSFKTLRPASWAFTANVIDSTISAFGVEAESGQLHYAGTYRDNAARSGPEGVIPHPTLPVIYVPNLWTAKGPSDLSTFVVDLSTGALVPQAPESIGKGPHHMALSPNGQTAYVASFGSDAVRVFRINQTSGKLTILDNVTTEDGPNDLVIDPLGRFAFLANQRASTISTFPIDPNTGLLIEPGLSVSTSVPPTKVRVDSTGAYLFASLEAAGQLTSWSINAADGSLSLIDSEPTCAAVASIHAHTSQPVLYVPSLTEDSLWVHTFDPDTGDISPLPYSLSIGQQPNAFTLDESEQNAFVTCSASKEVYVLDISSPANPTITDWKRGRPSPRVLGLVHGNAPLQPQANGLFVRNTGEDSISAFRVDATRGDLRLVDTEWMAQSGSTSMALDRRGRHLCVTFAGANALQTYGINPQTLTLDTLGSTFDLGRQPGPIDLAPSGRFVYVSFPSDNSVTSYRLQPHSGALTIEDSAALPIGTAAIRVDPTGQFLYIVAAGGGVITGYAIDEGQFGASLGQVPIAQGTVNASLSFSRQAHLLYATLEGVNQVVTCSINAVDGSLAAVGLPATIVGSPLAYCVHPSLDLAFAPLGSIGQDGEIGLLSLDPQSGTPTLINSLPYGLGPADLLLDPLGGFLFSANRSGDDVSVMSVDSQGGLIEIDTQRTGSAPGEVELRRSF